MVFGRETVRLLLLAFWITSRLFVSVCVFQPVCDGRFSGCELILDSLIIIIIIGTHPWCIYWLHHQFKWWQTDQTVVSNLRVRDSSFILFSVPPSEFRWFLRTLCVCRGKGWDFRISRWRPWSEKYARAGSTTFEPKAPIYNVFLNVLAHHTPLFPNACLFYVPRYTHIKRTASRVIDSEEKVRGVSL